MEKKGPYFTVGLFVMLGVIGLVVFALWLGGSIDTRNYKHYTVHFNDTVSGLKEGAGVQYRGVDVGKVTLVELVSGHRNLIRVIIQVDPEVPVGAGTVAQLEVLGITGLVYLSLATDPNDEGGPRMVEGEKYPVIEGRGTQLSKLLTDIPAITRRIAETTERVNKLFNDESIEKLQSSINNVENLTRDMNGLLSAENVAAAGAVLQNSSTAMQDISALSRQSQELVARLEKTAASIDEAAKAMNDMVQKSAPSIARFSQDGLQDIEQTSKAARKMADRIRKTAKDLGDDPSQILYPPQDSGTAIPH